MSALIEKFRFAGDSALEGDGFRTFGPAVKEGFPRPATRASARDPTGRRRKRHDHVEGRKMEDFAGRWIRTRRGVFSPATCG
jgi:hypothetical protein